MGDVVEDEVLAAAGYRSSPACRPQPRVEDRQFANRTGQGEFEIENRRSFDTARKRAQAHRSGFWGARGRSRHRDERVAGMAEVGDRVVIRGRHVDDSDRSGVITAVLGNRGTAPYRVRFQDGRERLIYPGPDATITAGDDPDTSSSSGPTAKQP